MLAAVDGASQFVTVRQGVIEGDAAAPASAVSRDGRYVAFVSYASPDGGQTRRQAHIYVLDRATGRVTLESAPPAGCLPGRACGAPSLSADGRFLAFETSDEGLAGGAPRLIVRLRDRRTGTTTSVAPHANGSIRDGSVSADGRVVVFTSSATNLVAGGDANGSAEDIYALDVGSGVVRRVSLGANDHQPAAGASFGSSVSGNGRFVAFSSTAHLDSLPARAVKGRPQVNVYVRDMLLGQTRRISVRSDGRAANGSSYDSSISDDGSYVAFVSDATDLVGKDDNRASDVCLFDTRTGKVSLVSRTGSGRSGNGPSSQPKVSADGGLVVFESDASDLDCARKCAPENRDINLIADVFAFDRAANAVRRISAGSTSWMEPSVAPAVDGTGGVVVFSSRHPRDGMDEGDDYDLFIGGMNKGTVVASKNRSP
jgi:Tol biopolymer transport system component